MSRPAQRSPCAKRSPSGPGGHGGEAAPTADALGARRPAEARRRTKKLDAPPKRNAERKARTPRRTNGRVATLPEAPNHRPRYFQRIRTRDPASRPFDASATHAFDGESRSIAKPISPGPVRIRPADWVANIARSAGIYSGARETKYPGPIFSASTWSPTRKKIFIQAPLPGKTYPLQTPPAGFRFRVNHPDASSRSRWSGESLWPIPSSAVPTAMGEPAGVYVNEVLDLGSVGRAAVGQ